MSNPPPRHSPLSAEDYRSLLGPLETSTNCFNAQSQKLILQFQHRDGYLSHKSVPSSNGIGTKKAIQQRQDLEIQHLRSLNEELKQNIRTLLLSQSTSTENAIRDIPSDLHKHLQADSQNFALVDRWSSSSQSDNTQSILLRVERANLLLDVLKQTLERGLRFRLDRVYKQALISSLNSQNLHHYENQHLEQLTKDLDSLYADIGDVTQMLVSHEHEKALKTTSTTLQRISQMTAINIENCIYAEIDKHNQDLLDFTKRRHLLYAHKAVLSSVRENLSLVEETHEIQLATQIDPVSLSPQKALESLRKHLDITALSDARATPQRVNDHDNELAGNLRKAVLSSKECTEISLVSEGKKLDDCDRSLDQLGQLINSSKQNVEKIATVADQINGLVGSLVA